LWEGRRKKEEGRRKREEGRGKNLCLLLLERERATRSLYNYFTSLGGVSVREMKYCEHH
jgi:hypothetical protein